MSAHDPQEHLINLKAQFDRHAAEAADEHLEQVRAELEQQLAAAEAPDSATVLGFLRDWEARLAASHPVIAGVVSDAIVKLESLGI